MSKLMHVRVGQQVKSRMNTLIDAGLFTNHVEIVREGLRDLLAKYPDKKNVK